jgi:WhiB family transcriptional regulator, redox-sensing transcriptional regulator
MDWQNDAACLSEDPDLFFPIGTTGDAVPQIMTAKSICATCPVLSTCLEYALETRQDYGVWGGLTEDERRSLRRSRQRRARRLAVTAA